jgi:excisionase family DNA binding protein
MNTARPTLAVTLTVDELEDLVRRVVRQELAAHVAAPAAEVLTREEAAELLRLHPHVLAKWVRTRGVPGQKVGSHWRFRRGELLAWLARQGKEASHGT